MDLKKMKVMTNKYLAIALTAFAAISLVSCNKYLDRNPLDADSDATHWKTEDAIKSYSWNLYGDLTGFSYGSGWTRGQYHGETLTDDYAPEAFASFTQNIPGDDNKWSTPYARIRKANVMLARIDMVPEISESAANHWRGVAKFFRALWHFELVKTFGDVVWVDGEVSLGDPEALSRARDPRLTVINNCISDLQFAVDNCYSPAKADVNTVNNVMAAALLSRVALYEAAWQKYHNNADASALYTTAKNAAEIVISSGLYDINNDYKANYTSSNLVGNKEMVFYMIYASASTGAAYGKGHSQFGWSDSSTPTWGLTKSAMENYATSAGLPIQQVAYDDKTMDGIFANRDARLTATVYKETLPVTEHPFIEGILSNTGYWTWKFVPLDEYDTRIKNTTWNGPANDTDGPIIGYPEILLNYAEACAELGSCTQADLDKSVNILRARHGKIPVLTLNGTSVSVNGTVINKYDADAANVLIQEIRRERRSELMADGFRHADLMRWALGKNLDFAQNPAGYLGASREAIVASAAVDAITAAKIDEKNVFVNGYKNPYGASISRTWNDKYYLEPIPSNQITRDPNLGQNPGWN